jgi:polar amino acid transport system substrate-binding protein
MRKVSLVGVSLAVVIAAVALAACGGSSSSDSSSEASSTGSEGAALPSALSSGLKVGMDVSYPPMEFYENGDDLTGIDPAVAQAIADKLGVPLEVQNIAFESLIPSLESNRISVIISGMKDTPERQRKLNMIDYFQTTLALIVEKGNPEGITDLQTLCGHTAGQVSGTITVALVEDASKECESGSIKVETFATNSAVNLAILAGRVDANLEDAVSLEYVAETAEGGDAYEAIPQPDLGDEYFGIATNKDEPEVTEAIRNAYKEVLEDGTLAKIYKEWDSSESVPSSFIENEGTE